MNRLTRFLFAVPALAILGCQDDRTPTAPDGAVPVVDIAHGDDGPNPNFTFLAPLVSAPAVSGAFDPSKNPTILVCEKVGDGCGLYVAGFLRTVGKHRIQVDEAEETYWLDWNTKEFKLSTDKTYRLKVFADSRVAGHIDLDVVATEAEAAAVDRSQFAPVVLGSTLPIRFRFVTDAEPPAEGTVRGRVIDAVTEAPLAGATVRFGERETTTGEDGTFTTTLPAGEWSVAASREGYLTNTLSDIELDEGETIDLGDIPLQPVQGGAAITLNDVRVGSGLMVRTSGALGTAAAGDLTLTITSSDPSKILVSRNAETEGSASIELPLEDGATDFAYWVHAIGGQTGEATLTATAEGYSDGTATATIAQPVLSILALPAEVSATGSNVAFRVQVSASGTSTDQLVRRGGGSYAVSVASSNEAAGKVLTSDDDEGAVTVEIAEGENTSAATVGAGGVAFDPIAQGTTDVTASAEGAEGATRQVTVTGGGLLTVRDTTVGGGLQHQTRVIFSTEEHGALTLRLESSDPDKLLLSRFGDTEGTAVLEIEVSSGAPQVTFVVQAIEGETGEVTVTASAPGFGSAEGTMTIVRPALSILNLQESIAANGANQVFRVRADLPNSNITQAPRVGGGGFPITLTSSNGDAAHIAVTGGSTGASVDAEIPEGEFATPFSGANALFVDPRAAGTTTIAVSSEFAAGASGQTEIVGGAVVINADTVGGGLQVPSRVTLPTAAHGGVTVTVTSSDPNRVLLRNTNGTAGAASIEIELNDGSPTAFFWLQGVPGATGTATVTATATGFASDDATILVLQPALRLLGLFEGQNLSLQAGNVDVGVQIGIPNAANDRLEEVQEVAEGTPTLTATITNSNTATGRLTGGGASPGSATLQIEPGRSIATGVEFEPLANGTTTVEAEIAGFVQTELATATVTVVDNSWRSTATPFRGDPVGTRHTFVCPADPPEDQRNGTVWGTDIYTSDSSVCRAAVHAGLITYASGGTVTFEMLGERNNFVGSTRNGVTTQSYAPTWGAFRFPAEANGNARSLIISSGRRGR